jgi:hypothetical protein
LARLDNVVGAILGNLTSAQDTANRHAAALAVEYGADPLLRHFPVPMTNLTDVEIDLRVLPISLTSAMGSRDRTVARAKASLDAFAAAAAGQLLKAAAYIFDRARALPEFPLARVDEIKASLQSPEFSAYLEKAIAVDLFAKRDDIVRPPAVLDTGVVSRTTLATVARVVLEHPDLKRFLQANPSFASEASDGIASELRVPMEALRKDFSSTVLFETEYDFNIAVDPAELNALPEHAISTIRIKARRSGYRWVVTQAGEPNELLPEE